jgi:hypothetical protein
MPRALGLPALILTEMGELYKSASSIVWSVEDLLDVAHDRDKWRAIVNSVMNLQIPKNTVNFFSK